MDDQFTGVLSFGAAILIAWFSFTAFHFFDSTSDKKITSGKKFKIRNAVYKCEKIQELDLK